MFVDICRWTSCLGYQRVFAAYSFPASNFFGVFFLSFSLFFFLSFLIQISRRCERNHLMLSGVRGWKNLCEKFLGFIDYGTLFFLWCSLFLSFFLPGLSFLFHVIHRHWSYIGMRCIELFHMYTFVAFVRSDRRCGSFDVGIERLHSSPISNWVQWWPGLCSYLCTFSPLQWVSL